MGREWERDVGGIGFSWIIEVAVRLFSVVLTAVTPEIKLELEAFLAGLLRKAKETPNPWDDFLVKFIMRMLGFNVSGD